MDDEFDRLLDDEDDELTAIRQARIAQLATSAKQRAEHVSLGHGSLRTIVQDEFLRECTGSSKFVVVHFFHADIERCKIIDFHLAIVARGHLEAKFLRIDAAKAPFFLAKLRIKTLPALCVFEDGKEVGRLPGFEGLAKDRRKPDEWHTERLKEWLSGTGAIEYERPSEEVAAVYSNRERSGSGEEY